MNEILFVKDMYRADQLAVEAGISIQSLMEAAGFAVASQVRKLCPKGRILILCGPGNNGGDGYVAARYLRHWGRGVDVVRLGPLTALGKDARHMARLWGNAPEWNDAQIRVNRYSLVVDALFGAGLSRPMDAPLVQLFRAVAGAGIPIVAVDVPSGLNGDGNIMGFVPPATCTVTFFRHKPAHLLCRDLCGEVVLAQIGIPDNVLDKIWPQNFVNDPQLWQRDFPKPNLCGHKYDRGHVLALAGPMVGAARLAARGARRAGAGLLTLLADPGSLTLIGNEIGAICGTMDQFDAALADPKRNVCLIGPGLGRDANAQARVMKVLASKKPVVLDADGLSAFAAAAGYLFAHLHENVVLTPHDGEFGRLFGKLPGTRLEQVQEAAKRSDAVVLLKGAETIIAHPSGRVVINAAHAPYLATAGSGDVLTGIIAGLIAQGMPSFDAACAGCWLHAQAGAKLGPGLIAEDIPEMLPTLIAALV